MPRPPRIDYPGAWHHVWQRGARREPIFKDDGHCIRFFNILDGTVQKLGLEVHGYSLMPNHYHLLVRTQDGNLSRCMQQIDGLYTQAINRLESWDGSLFRGRFKNQLVENETYLMELAAYLHLNPVRARLALSPEDECWTSHTAYVGHTSKPPWLSCDVILDLFGGAKEFHAFVQRRHLKQTDWPGEMDLETGWLKLQDEKPAGVPPVPLKETRRKGQRPDVILDKVKEIAGVSSEKLLMATRGPGANPARRFAVIALYRWSNLTQGEIGQRLEISINQVRNILTRSRSSKVTVISDWLAELEKSVLSDRV